MYVTTRGWNTYRHVTDNVLQQVTEQNNSKVIEQILVNVTEHAPAMTEQIKGLLTEKATEQMSEISLNCNLCWALRASKPSSQKKCVWDWQA